MTTKVPAAMCDADVPTTASVAAAAAAANVKLSGDVVQVVYAESSALATGTTLIPYDDTIPQQTEGDQYLTASITPTDAASLLKIDVTFNGSHSAAADFLSVALFRDAGADAIAAVCERSDTAGGKVMSFTKRVTAGSTSATTFKVRAGGNSAGTTSFNGNGGARRFGGVAASSITVTEIKA